MILNLKISNPAFIHYFNHQVSKDDLLAVEDALALDPKSLNRKGINDHTPLMEAALKNKEVFYFELSLSCHRFMTCKIFFY